VPYYTGDTHALLDVAFASALACLIDLGGPLQDRLLGWVVIQLVDEYGRLLQGHQTLRVWPVEEKKRSENSVNANEKSVCVCAAVSKSFGHLLLYKCILITGRTWKTI